MQSLAHQLFFQGSGANGHAVGAGPNPPGQLQPGPVLLPQLGSSCAPNPLPWEAPDPSQPGSFLQGYLPQTSGWPTWSLVQCGPTSAQAGAALPWHPQQASVFK